MSARKESRKKVATTQSNQTEKYLAEVSQAWSTLLVGNIPFPLYDLYKPLYVGAKEKTPLGTRFDFNYSKPDKTFSMGQILAEKHKIVLLGAPGAGKSTTLQYIGYCFSTPSISDEKLGKKDESVPLLLSLKIYEDVLSVAGTLLEDALAKEVNQILRIGIKEAHELLIAWRDTGKLLILLDGLDEVAETKRVSIRKEIQAFSAANPKASIILSSRTAGYTAIGSGFEEFDLLPLQSADEINQYIETWLTVFYSSKPDKKPDVNIEAQNLSREIRLRPSLEKILDNPLILRLAAEEYVRTGKVANNRLSLYENWIESAWERAEQRGAESSQKQPALRQLEDLAWCLQNNLDLPEYDETLLCEKLGLLARVENHVVFVHQTLQEYMVSRRLFQVKKDNPAGFWNFTRARLHISFWREPLLLLIPHLPAKESEDFIVSVSNAKSASEKILNRDASLAILLAGELETCSPMILSVLIKLLKGLREYRGYGDGAHILWHIFSNYGHLVFDELVSLLHFKNPEVAKTAAKALGQMKDRRGMEALIRLMKDKNPQVRIAVIEGFSWHDETKQYLKTMIYDDKDSEVRKEAFSKAFWFADDLSREDALKAIQSNDQIMKRYGIQSLGKIHNPEDMNVLAEIIFNDKDDFVREDVVRALEGFDKLSDYVIWALLIVIVGDISMASILAKKNLPESLHPRVIKLLLYFIKKDPKVREAGIYAFGRFESLLALDILVDALDDKDPEIRKAAAYSLGKLKFKDDRLIQRLLIAMDDTSADVQVQVAHTLGDLLIIESRDRLIELLQNSQDENVRKACLRGLKTMYFPSPLLKKDIIDGRRLNIDKKVNLDAKPVIAAFVRSLGDASPDVRHSAAEALGDTKSADAFTPLIDALQGDDAGARSAIIYALQDIGDVRAVGYLLPMLKDYDPETRLAAVKTLTQIPSPAAIHQLFKVLKGNWQIRYGYAKDYIAEAILECQKAVEPSQRDTPENRKQLKAIIKLAQKYQLSELLAFATAELEMLSLIYIDPALPYRPSRRGAMILRIVIWIILAGVIALLMTISDLAKNLVSDAPWLEPVKTMIWQHPLRVFLGLVAVLMLVAVLTYFQNQQGNKS